MSAEQMARLFQPFSQADSSITRRHGGTGLGLVISKRLAELMGGGIGVESTIGGGSRFWFTARLQSCAQRVFEVQPDLRGCRALVVDDSFEARAAVADMLTGMSLHVAEARDGFEAVDLVRHAALDGSPFDIVYVDCRMPGIDGFETAARLRALGLEQPPVLMMVSAYAREDMMQRAAGEGVDKVLVKPVRPSILFDATIEALARRRRVKAQERRPQTPPPPAEPPEELAALRGVRVLLVEDNEINQLVAKAILDEAGTEVDIAGNGSVAIDMCRAGRYDVVLMDVQMPVMDGLTATRELRAQGERLPIIAMTANAMERDRQLCLDAGMDDVLTKPVDPQLLWNRLLRWARPEGLASSEVTADATMPPREPEFGELSGVDVRAGLAHVRGDAVLYRTLLERFVQAQAQVPGQIRIALAHGDVAQAEMLGHTLKGVATNLGIARVALASDAFEHALRAYEPPVSVQARLEVLAAAMDEAVPVLSEALGA
jgi:two-component system sensor histidine kinase/response regulator